MGLDRLRRALRTLLTVNATPSRLFAACLVGAIVGCTPFFGLHLPICLALAAVLGLNPVAVYAAANVSIPPIAPFLAVACIDVGGRVLALKLPAWSVSAIRATSPWTLARSVFGAWLVGALFVGGGLGSLLGGVVFFVARGRPRRIPAALPPFDRARLELVNRFRDAPPGIRHYVAWKVRLDPVYRAIAADLPDAVHVVDLGSGLGILPILLCLLGSRRTAAGFEWDARKADFAREAARGLPIALSRADVRTEGVPACDAVAIVDVLHYLDTQGQRELLARAVSALRPGGVIYVREGDAERSSGGFTRAIERLAVRVGWNRSARRPGFRPIVAIADDLRALGLEVRMDDVAGKLHPGNVLLRGTKAEGILPSAPAVG